ncbi:Aste57867_10692 [Aphanomyces stellatus]|uniref:Aste57867_10692 protein n=1 Tax=Aphanomyces stellatus TaxID=120398 RepID=A0A485KRM3_9STRA|nr:hypothetical protein As57867_010652 [Aphanomyces stellatus]VFT87562.1 Aste57867_10692 [Aphanomyces stellatus]
MSGIGCAGCSFVNPPTLPRCIQCKKMMPDDKAKVILLHEQLLAMQKRFVELSSEQATLRDDCDVDADLRRRESEFKAKEQRCDEIMTEMQATATSLLAEAKTAKPAAKAKHEAAALRKARKEWEQTKAADEEKLRMAWDELKVAEAVHRKTVQIEKVKQGSLVSIKTKELKAARTQVTLLKKKVQALETEMTMQTRRLKKATQRVSHLTLKYMPATAEAPRATKKRRVGRLTKDDDTSANDDDDDVEVVEVVGANEEEASDEASEGEGVDDEGDVIDDDNQDTSIALPRGWKWPNVPVANQWQLWYCGDGVVGPLSRVARDHPTRVPMGVKRVVQKFIDTAVAHDIAESPDVLETLNDKTIAAVFDQTWDVLLFHNPEGNLIDEEPFDAVAFRAMKASVLVKYFPRTPTRSNWEFVWPGGTRHLVPPDWEIDPATTPLRTLWFYWFRGDADSGIGPFRCIPSRELKGCKGRTLHLVSSLAAIPVALDLVPSEGVLMQLPEPKLMALFDQVLAIWQDEIPDEDKGKGHGWDDGSVSCATATAVYVVRKRKSLP